MNLSVSLSLTSAAAIRSGGNPLASLFANGEDGFQFMPAAPPYLFQSSDGITTPVAANDDPVAFWKDRSPRGRNAIQAGSAGERPLYKTNSGKPYILPDGVNDSLRPPFVPSGAARTLAVAVNFASSNAIVMGGGTSGLNHRCYIGVAGVGLICLGWGVESGLATGGYGSNILNTNVVALLTGDATFRALYLNGTLMTTAVSNGTPLDTLPIWLGANNNSGLANPSSARIYGSFALSRVVTAPEIALITAELQRTFQ